MRYSYELQKYEETGYNLDLDLQSVSPESCVPYPRIGRIANHFRPIYLTSGNSTTRTLTTTTRTRCFASHREPVPAEKVNFLPMSISYFHAVGVILHVWSFTVLPAAWAQDPAGLIIL